MGYMSCLIRVNWSVTIRDHHSAPLSCWTSKCGSQANGVGLSHRPDTMVRIDVVLGVAEVRRGRLKSVSVHEEWSPADDLFWADPPRENTKFQAITVKPNQKT